MSLSHQNELQLLENPRLDPIEWDELVARSRTPVVFLTAGWLTSAWETWGAGATLWVPTIRRGGRLVAAAAFAVRGGDASLLGDGTADILDLIIDAELDDDDAAQLSYALLDALVSALPNLRALHLRHVPIESGTPERLAAAQGLHQVVTRYPIAPTMEMDVVEWALRKKSLRRHTNRLAREGQVELVSSSAADDVLPRLEVLFDQHRRRCAEAGRVSQFQAAHERRFFRHLTTRLGAAGYLRFVELRLDGAPIAMHFGSHFCGRYLWYKPAFDPDYGHLSPGEVLLRYLLQEARAEHAREFDFGVGDEAFKSRFSTRERQLVDMVLTPSRLRAAFRRGYVVTRRQAARILKGN